MQNLKTEIPSSDERYRFMKKLLPTLIVLLMILIFLLSSQRATESAELSSGFCELAARLIYRKFSDYSPTVQTVIVKGLSRFIRKLAHFAIYALLGALCYLWLYRKPHNIAVSMLFCATYASFDELHQRFVPGRSGALTDVFLDCFGSACGIAAAFVLLCICYCIRRRRIVKRGVWNRSVCLF